MSVLKDHPPPLPAAEPVPVYFETDRIVTPADNPAPNPMILADLVASLRESGQLVPGVVARSPDLPDSHRLCIEGNTRLAGVRLLGLRFWAFDLGREISEAERIQFCLLHNLLRRVMSREEIAQKAGRYMELTGCNAAQAAKRLKVSPATLSRAFGDQRIPSELVPRAETLKPSIRSLIAALPPQLMAQAIEFAEAVGPDDKRPTRDQVAAFCKQLRKSGTSKGGKPKTVTLKVNGRIFTFSVRPGEPAASVISDLQTIAVKAAKLGHIDPQGWHYHFS